ASRQSRLILWYRSLKSETRLLRIEQHPHRDGIGDPARYGADEYLDAELYPGIVGVHLLRDCSCGLGAIDRRGGRIADRVLRRYIAVGLGSVSVVPRKLGQKREVNDLVHCGNERERHAVHDLVGNAAQVLLVCLGENHLPEPGPIRSHHLLLDTTDLQNFSAERHLTGERNVTTDWAPAQYARDRQRDRRAGAGSVLWNCASGKVNVQIDFLELDVLNTQCMRARSNVGIRSID